MGEISDHISFSSPQTGTNRLVGQGQRSARSRHGEAATYAVTTGMQDKGEATNWNHFAIGFMSSDRYYGNEAA